MTSTLAEPSCWVTKFVTVEMADDTDVDGLRAKFPVAVLIALAYTEKFTSLGSEIPFFAYWLNSSWNSEDLTKTGLLPTLVVGGTNPAQTAVLSMLVGVWASEMNFHAAALFDKEVLCRLK